MTKRSDEDKQLDAAIAEINKLFGEDDLVARLGTLPHAELKAISTSVVSLDQALGCGGFPCRRISEVYGPPSNGKTALCLCAIAEAQKIGKSAAFIDAEHSFDRDWAAALGVDVDRLVFMQPHCGEEALDVVEKLAKAGAGIIVVDSVAALTPRAEIDGVMGESFMGLQARLVSQAMRKLNGVVSRSGTALVFINQVREKIGGYGNPEKATGGRALEFYASVRIAMRRTEVINEGELKGVAIRSIAKIVKNKVGPAFDETAFDIYNGKCSCHPKGVDVAGDVFDVAVKKGIVEKNGSWYYLDGERLGQGRQAAAANLVSNPDVLISVKQRIVKP